MAREDKRVFGLDVWRAFAAFCVVYGHGYNLIYPHLTKPLYDVPRLDAVTMFFVLSGFLLGRVLLRAASAEEFEFSALTQFWVRRGLRTLPAYFLILTFVLVAAHWLRGRGWPLPAVHAGTILGFYTFTQNIAWPHPLFFDEAWSLSVIEWFYLVMPVLLYLLLRGVRGEARQRRILFWIVAPMLADIVFRLYWVHSHGIATVYDWDMGLRKEVLPRVDLLMFGVLAAHASLRFTDSWRRLATPALVCGLALLILDKVLSAGAQPMFYLNYFNLTVVPLGVALLLPAAASWNPSFKTVTPWSRAVRWVADASYSLYLVNLTCVQKLVLPPLMSVLGRWCPRCDGGWLTRYLLYWILCLIAAAILYRCVERPLGELRDRLRERRAMAQRAAGVPAPATG
jgi:peptidoglycan/LPS O-acetylase OafA/YrhL